MYRGRGRRGRGIKRKSATYRAFMRGLYAGLRSARYKKKGKGRRRFRCP